jgi:hypothetical protein
MAAGRRENYGAAGAAGAGTPSASGRRPQRLRPSKLPERLHDVPPGALARAPEHPADLFIVEVGELSQGQCDPLLRRKAHYGHCYRVLPVVIVRHTGFLLDRSARLPPPRPQAAPRERGRDGEEPGSGACHMLE